MADGAFPLVLLDPPGCNAHVGGYGGLMKPMPQIKHKLIILDFTSTRTFSNHNIVVTTHEKYYKLAQTNKIDLID
jgi:hypothetical protein